MAIPKRILRRAIDRNTVRRIAREAWRASVSSVAGAAGAQRAGVPGDATPGPARAAKPRTVLLRLMRRPERFAALGYRARKRLWRAELDALFARAASAAPAGRSSGAHDG